jgi:hypothetical protein
VTGLDYFTFAVLIVLTLAGLAGAVFLASLPGKIAEHRGHPQSDAIRVAGWLGLLTMGLLFPVALIWAYTRPSATPEIADLRQQVNRLRGRVEAFESDRARRGEDGAPTS